MADRVTRTLNLKTINPWLTRLYGLAGIAQPGGLVSVDNGRTVVEFDLQTGLARRQFAAYGPFVCGAGVVDGQIWLGSPNLPDVVRVYTRSGVWQRTLQLPYGVTALGSDDQPEPVAGAAHAVTVAAAGLAADIDFGDTRVATAPAAPDLADVSDTGSSATDNLTRRANTRRTTSWNSSCPRPPRAPP